MNREPDCVKMKRDIQEALRQEYSGLTDNERLNKIRKDNQEDKELADFFDKIPVRSGFRVAASS